MNKIALPKNVRVSDRTAELAVIASNVYNIISTNIGYTDLTWWVAYSLCINMILEILSLMFLSN